MPPYSTLLLFIAPQPPRGENRGANGLRASRCALRLVAVFLLLSAPLLAAPLRADYHLTFDDEFNSFHASRWQTADFFGIRHNGGDYQGQWFADPNSVPAGVTQKPYNAFSFANGVLTIRAQATPENVFSGAFANFRPQPYVSGQLTTAHKFTQRYGYFELRAKLPPGKGLWSRFWLLTDDGNWPGEYDIFEVLGKGKPVKVHQTTHYRDAKTPHGTDGSAYDGIVPTDGQFHTYGFLWDAKNVTWFVDGVATLTQSNRINIPMYALLDLAVGNDPGNLWPGTPDDTTPWPADMEMDYFRVYSNDPSLPSVTPDAGYKASVLPNGHKVETTPITAKLPDDWTVGDLGAPDVKGCSTWNPLTGEWMLKGSGYGIGGYGDQCQFAGAPLSGDGGITATVQNVTAINSNDVKAGVMIREGTGQSARAISLLHSTSNKAATVTSSVVFQSRNASGGVTTMLTTLSNIATPVTLRLTRSGNTFAGAYSSDEGQTWIPVGTPQTLMMGDTVQAGLVVGGNQSNYHRLSRATFDKVTVGKLAASPNQRKPEAP